MKTNKTRLTLTPPAPFDFERTAYSHGWVVLAPNGWDAERKALRRAERLGPGRCVALEIRGAGPEAKRKIAIAVEHSGKLSPKERGAIKTAVGRMFRVDEDLSEFYALCKKRGDGWEKMTAGLGKLLRSPTVFEDAVKVICTTNIQWGGTKRMADRLVEAYGEAGAFPEPEAIASADPEVFAQTARMGYRAPFVHELATRIVSGDLDLEALARAELATPELKKELLAIKGVGAYAAASLLMILGRYDELAVDTVFRQFVRKKYFGGERPSDAKARAIYDEWGEWKYLAYWLDLWEGFDGEL